MLLRRRLLAAMLLVAATVLVPFPGPASAAPSPAHVQLHATQRVTGLEQPLGIVSSRDGTGRLFVVGKTGAVRIYSGGVLRSTPYLDLRGQIATDGERGLLGLAFDPDFVHHPNLWIVYTRKSDGAVTLSRYSVPSYTASTVNQSTGLQIMAIRHPASNHNGGQLFFGTDNLLYWTVGDDATRSTAQVTNVLTGKVLRIDPRRFCGSQRYCIPSTNPFVGHPTYRYEIWLWGLRNPWRASVDRVARTVWIGDVGQNRFEEVDVVSESFTGWGGNLGWGCYEGNFVYDASLCTRVPHIFPRIAYTHAYGEAVTGGYVYRGRAYASLLGGLYVYGDYGSGNVWVAGSGGSVSQGPIFGSHGLSSFGEDAAGELWAVTIDGILWQLSATAR